MTGLKHLSVFIATVVITLVFCVSCATDSQNVNTANGGAAEDLTALDKSSGVSDAELESDLKQTEAKTSKTKAPAEKAKDEFAQFEEPKAEPPPAEKLEAAKPTPEPPPPAPEPVAPPSTPEPVVQTKPEAPAVSEVPSEAAGLVHLNQIFYRGNDNGGTVVIEADGPMTFSTRMNPTAGQFVIDIPNSILSKKLKHPYITKDFDSMIGGIDAYQNKGSNVSRVVIHLKPGATEPVVQAEGSSLMVVANLPPPPPPKEEVKLLSYATFQDFLSGNMVFSGKKISIETDDIELKDLFKLISEEAGINLMVGEEVKGTMSVKLRQVPWDQVLVMVLKSKKLGYQKVGNILRIVSSADLKTEETEILESAKARQATDPLVVKVIPINYAKIDEITKQIDPFLTKGRGSVAGDTRTNSIVVTDIADAIKRITQLIAAIDIPPQQVLIEGKVVEAQESFENQIGVQWNVSGVPTKVGGSTYGPVSGIGTVGSTPLSVAAPTMSIGFNAGVLDTLGNLTALLQLQEAEGKVKILSSPRVLALHNEEAKISQTQQIPITATTPSSTPGGAPMVTVSYKDVKLELGVTPQITNDGAVLMKVDVIREFAGATTSPKDPPPIHSRKSNTKVLVRNGQTAVIGGIYQDDFSDSESRVPWLGQIPVLGWLFKSKVTKDYKNELLIFLTPRILSQIDHGLNSEKSISGNGESSGDNINKE